MAKKIARGLLWQCAYCALPLVLYLMFCGLDAFVAAALAALAAMAIDIYTSGL
jgi:hypothetical protein